MDNLRSFLSSAKQKYTPPGYVIAACMISVGGFLNGYDTGSIGAVIEMPHFKKQFGILNPTLHGFTVSVLMLAGAVPSVFAGQLADRFGRLVVSLVGALIFAAGAALQGTSFHLQMFIVGRVLCGLGEGIWLSNVNVYICEISPSKVRGTLISVNQLMCALGICLGYFTCYGTIHFDSSMSWRTVYIVQVVLALYMAVTCVVLPNSPRWLVLHGRRDEAIKELEKLDYSMTEAEKDFLQSNEVMLSKTGIESFFMLFQRKYRLRTFLALFILGMAQLSGIDGVLYYAPILFAQAGLPGEKASFLASGVSAILMLAITIPALLLADRTGRRTSVISGGLALSSSMILIGSMYASNSVHSYGPGRWVVILMIFVFALSYSFTWAVVAKIYASEIQPADTRAAATCVAQGLGFLTNWLVAMITPLLLASSSYSAYFLFGSLALGTVIVMFIYMPETKGRSLESIHEAFQQPQLRSWGAAWAFQLRRLLRLFSVTLPSSDAMSLSSGNDPDGLELSNLGDERNEIGETVNASSVDPSVGTQRFVVATA